MTTKRQAKSKRLAIVMRTKAAINTDRAEGLYRERLAHFTHCVEALPMPAVIKALPALQDADSAWLIARRAGLMVESVWRGV